MSGIDRVRYLTLCLIAQMSCRKSACSAFWTTRKIGYIIYHCDGFSTERWDAMQCPEHTFQTSILHYISSSRSSRKWHAGSRSVAHSGPRARSGDSLPALAQNVGGLCGRETARLRAGFRPQSSAKVGQVRRAWFKLPPRSVSPAAPSYPRPDTMQWEPDTLAYTQIRRWPL